MTLQVEIQDLRRMLKEKCDEIISDKNLAYEFYVRICEIEEDNRFTIVDDEQEAKTGYWIESAGNDKCSICGTEYSDLYPDYGNTHFCPNCGAKMEGR